MTTVEMPTDALPNGESPSSGGADAKPRDPHHRAKVVLLLTLSLLLLVMSPIAIWYLVTRQPITQLPVLAGPEPMPAYSTSVYGMSHPMGVAVSADGSRIYVGESSGKHTARIFDSSGKEIGLLQPPTSTGTDHAPVYLAVNPTSGDVYVSDRLSGAIYVYDASGNYLRSFDMTAAKGVSPLGLAFDAAGHLFVTDVGTAPQRVVEFDTATGQVVRSIAGDGKFSFPNGVAVDQNGLVYVTDSNNGRLVAIDASDKIVATVGRGVGSGNLGLPRGISIDSHNRIFLADSTGQQVFVYATVKPGESTITFLGSIGGEGIADAQFEYPNATAVDARGRVYVADSANDRVQLWSY